MINFFNFNIKTRRKKKILKITRADGFLNGKMRKALVVTTEEFKKCATISFFPVNSLRAATDLSNILCANDKTVYLD